MSDLHRKLLGDLGALPPKPKSFLPPSTSSSAAATGSNQQKRKRDYTPLSWSIYFDTYKDVVTDQNNHFRVYVKGNEGPVVFFLHGGGFSGLSWALLSSILTKKITCQCYSMDIRGHGDSQTLNDDDLSMNTLANDIKLVIEALWKDEEEPPIVLVGHSMGGAIGVHTGFQKYVKSLVALIVIDVVEGSAMDALSSMQAFLQGRPKSFNSMEHAIEYSVRSGQIRNCESARVSMVGQIRKETLSSANELNTQSIVNISPSKHIFQTKIIEEDEEMDETVEGKVEEIVEPTQKHSMDKFKVPQEVKERFVWRIDLTKTEKYWSGWFKGLSNMFLSIPQPKLLLLAGVDRLDKELMVGQMQGKFQMQVLPKCGHAVHEDSPDEVSDAIATFLVRNKIATILEDFSRPYPSC